MNNLERAAEVMETHDLFHFTSGDGWMEPYEDVIRCACGEEFFSYIQTGDGSGDDDRDPNLLYRQHLAQALADAGLLMPDLPDPTRVITPTWVEFSDNIAVHGDGVNVYFADNYGEDPEILSPDEARSAAFNLLAAAKLAEEQE